MYVGSLAPFSSFALNMPLTHFVNYTSLYHLCRSHSTLIQLPLDQTWFLFFFHWDLLFFSQWSMQANGPHLVSPKLSTSDLESQEAWPRYVFARLSSVHLYSGISCGGFFAEKCELLVCLLYVRCSCCFLPPKRCSWRWSPLRLLLRASSTVFHFNIDWSSHLVGANY